MNKGILVAIRVSVTLITVLVAVWIVVYLVENYFKHPWTRDAQVQAQVIQITSRVSGPVIALPIKDNQLVKKGDLLWKIEPSTYLAKVANTKADLDKAKYAAIEAKDLATRARALLASGAGAISIAKVVKLTNNQHLEKAAALAAKANWNAAKLDLAFTQYRSPADGYVTNLRIHVGSHVVENKAVLALVDIHTFWMQAFFKETMLKHIKPGDKAIIKLMSYPNKPAEGIVDSIGWGIAQQDGSTSNLLLPSVNPSFDWIRLAQRIPVRIHFTNIPKGVHLRVGSTATVIILHK
ncbi:MAG: HlyD family secretion protein [Coxiellaceae bacterium]|nr:HlyD family secretion protein [Coxiellaceae bacterium]